MQSANQELEQQSRSESAVSISDIQEVTAAAEPEGEDAETAQLVQMDIACGVVDLKDQAALRAAEAMLSGIEQTIQRDHTEFVSDTETDSNSDANSADASDKTSMPAALQSASQLSHSKSNTESSRESGLAGKRDDASLRPAKRQRKKLIEVL